MKIQCVERYHPDQVAEIHSSAFGPEQGPEIVALVQAMSSDVTAQPMRSLTATVDGNAAGHVFFSQVTIDPGPSQVPARILAPLGVAQPYQRHGVGTALVSQGLNDLRESGVGLVFVLGDPQYYTQFGFRPATPNGLLAPHPIPSEYADAWMVVELQPGILGHASGTVHCSTTLSDPRHWFD